MGQLGKPDDYSALHEIADVLRANLHDDVEVARVFTLEDVLANPDVPVHAHTERALAILVAEGTLSIAHWVSPDDQEWTFYVYKP